MPMARPRREHRTLPAVVLLSASLAIAACSSGGGRDAARTTAGSAVAAPSTTVAEVRSEGSNDGRSGGHRDGCDATDVSSGNKPAWAETAPDIPWVADRMGMLAGFLFADPLRHGHLENPANKILWVVNGSRNGSPLRVELQPFGRTAPVVTDSFPADSFPGEIYPSIVEVPSAGCWHATFRWGGHTAELDLPFV